MDWFIKWVIITRVKKEMKEGELSMLNGSLFYKVIISQDGNRKFFLRTIDDRGFWSQHKISKEKVEEFLRDNRIEKV